MATTLSTSVSQADLPIIKSAIAILNNALAPYRDRAVISKKLFGLFTISFTIGDVLDFLLKEFGTPTLHE